TLLPMGVLQLEASLTHGYWYARSAEFMSRPIIDVLVWLRVPGDTVLAIGAFLVAMFVVSLWLGPRPVSAPSAQQRALARERGQEAGWPDRRGLAGWNSTRPAQGRPRPPLCFPPGWPSPS